MTDSGDLSREASAQAASIGRLGCAEEMADAVLWLCSPVSSYVIGLSIAVDGGCTIVYTLSHIWKGDYRK